MPAIHNRRIPSNLQSLLSTELTNDVSPLKAKPSSSKAFTLLRNSSHETAQSQEPEKEMEIEQDHIPDIEEQGQALYDYVSQYSAANSSGIGKILDSKLIEAGSAFEKFIVSQESKIESNFAEYLKASKQLCKERTLNAQNFQSKFENHQNEVSNLINDYETIQMNIQNLQINYLKDMETVVESFKIEASSIEAKSQRILNSFNKGAEKLGKNDVDLGHVRKSLMSLI